MSAKKDNNPSIGYIYVENSKINLGTTAEGNHDGGDPRLELPRPPTQKTQMAGATGDVGTARMSEAALEEKARILALKDEILQIKEQALNLKHEALAAQQDALYMKRECLEQWEGLLHSGQVFHENMGMLASMRQQALDARQEAIAAQERMVDMMARAI
ncbi:hypothetical protein ONZ43_g3296 [Nemania bipapillata]|uniref:Uncharacterized protein n=1 Tax=Nemania bipapillata TaxID=110536 RepID=A0ACC2IX73_9PEZI|nr:hypothetical protein ONZ43_g3296 [Nemania bipapillata]